MINHRAIHDSDRTVIVDGLGIVVISVFIAFAANRLHLMQAIVAAVIAGRFILLALTRAEDRRISMRTEIIFYLICTLFGAFNDWNSVCNKRIYDYTVPFEDPISTIPFWMLAYWGLILRFVARLTWWERLGPPDRPSDLLCIGKFTISNGTAKVLAQLAVVVLTRQTIYRFYLDPWLSWIPFTLALIVFITFFKPTKHDLKLSSIFLIGGPLIEALYIKVGHLHWYHLGIIGGVPLWIILWWVVIVIIWKDLSGRMVRGLEGAG